MRMSARISGTPASAGREARQASPATASQQAAVLKYRSNSGISAAFPFHLQVYPFPMLDALTQRLSNVVKTLRGHARLTEDNVQEMLREVRLALLDADAGLPVVRDFIAGVKDKALGQEVLGSLTPGQALVGVVHQELVTLMGGAGQGLDFATQPPAVILLAGLQGSGKTTSAGKLARLIRNTTKKKGLLVSTDVYRPAAIEQPATPAKKP